MPSRSLSTAFLSALATASALHATPRPLLRTHVSPLHVVCADTSGQGFGAPKPPPPPKKKKADRAIPTAATNTNSVVSTPEWSAGGEGEQLYNAEARGRQLLEEMRQSSGETPTILKKPGMQLTEEEQRPIDPTEGVMPEEVADRMLKRIIPFAAGPVVLGVFVLIGFWFANTQMQMDLPPSIVAYATQACLLLSFAGITYGVMSTDLEEGADQSLLGAENFQKNLDNMRGAEDARIADAKYEAEVEDAMRSGITLKPGQKSMGKEDDGFKLPFDLPKLPNPFGD